MATRLISAFFAILLIICPFGAHASETILLDEAITIAWWHNATAYYKFSSNELAEAVLSITSTTHQQYYRGWMSINGKWYQLKNEGMFSRNIPLGLSGGNFLSNPPDPMMYYEMGSLGLDFINLAIDCPKE